MLNNKPIKAEKLIRGQKFIFTRGESQMKKSDKKMKVWSAILVPAILSGFGMGLKGGGEGIL